MMLTLAGASLLLPTSPTPDQRTVVVVPRLFIAVHAAPDIEPALVDRTLDEASAIWRAVGVVFDRQIAPGQPYSSQLTVSFDDEPLDFSEQHGALGWIPFTAAGPLPVIHLSRTRAEVLCSQWPNIANRTIAGHRLLIARALGRALSHEIGHYLFQSRVHTRHGLMRAKWPSDELFGFDGGGFTLTREQRDAAEQYFAGASATTAEPPSALAAGKATLTTK
jgi:hypothetical protein